MAHFERALGVRPGDPGVRYQMVTIYVSRGETERALPLLEAIVKEAPAFLEAHVTLATVYYRLKRREDGDRERAIVDALNKEIQAKQPGAVAPNTPETPPVRTPDIACLHGSCRLIHMRTTLNLDDALDGRGDGAERHRREDSGAARGTALADRARARPPARPNWAGTAAEAGLPRDADARSVRRSARP